MKRICTLLMAVVFLSVTAISTQAATAKPSKKDTKTEVSQKLKKDGTVDKRYKQADAAAKDAKVAPAKVSKQVATTGEHLKKDGSADMRYKENKEGHQKDVKHLKKDGTPDKRFKENK
jgi:hypothetical protein